MNAHVSDKQALCSAIDAEHRFRAADEATKRQIAEFIEFVTRKSGS